MKNTIYYVVTTLLCLDIVLYFSGSFSVVNLILAGIPFLHMILIAYLAISGFLFYKSSDVKYGVMFVIYLFIVVGVLMALAPNMKERSKSAMVSLADSIIRGENSKEIQVSGDSDLDDVINSMTKVSLDDYYPVERRADFVVVDKNGNSFDFILTLHGINNAKVFVKQRDG